MMITPLLARIITRPRLPKRKRIVTCSSRPEITPAKVIEAVAGKTAAYGVILGTANWIVSGANPIEQYHRPEFACLGVLCSAISAYSVDGCVAQSKSIEEFDKVSYVETGRLAMIIFTSMLIGCSI